MKNFSHGGALARRRLLKLRGSIRLRSFSSAKLAVPSLIRRVLRKDLFIKESADTERLLITNLNTIEFELVRGQLVV